MVCVVCVVCSVARKLLYCDLCCVLRCDMLHCMSSWGGSGVCVCVYVCACACMYLCVHVCVCVLHGIVIWYFMLFLIIIRYFHFCEFRVYSISSCMQPLWLASRCSREAGVVFGKGREAVS